MTPEKNKPLSIEARLSLLTEELEDVRKSVRMAVEFIRGNGDPTKGLLWVTADLTRLLATNTQLLEAHRQVVADHVHESEKRWAKHIEEAHRERRSEFWEKVKDTAVKQVVTGAIITILSLLALGVITFVRNGGHL